VKMKILINKSQVYKITKALYSGKI